MCSVPNKINFMKCSVLYDKRHRVMIWLSYFCQYTSKWIVCWFYRRVFNSEVVLSRTLKLRAYLNKIEKITNRTIETLLRYLTRYKDMELIKKISIWKLLVLQCIVPWSSLGELRVWKQTIARIQPLFTCPKLIVETPKQNSVKTVQN